MSDFIGDQDKVYELVVRIRHVGTPLNRENRKELLDEATKYLYGKTVGFTDSYLAGFLAGIELMEGGDK